MTETYRSPMHPLPLLSDERVEPWKSPITGKWNETPRVDAKFLEYARDFYKDTYESHTRYAHLELRASARGEDVQIVVAYRGAMRATRTISGGMWKDRLALSRDIIEAADDCIAEIDATLGILPLVIAP